MLKPLLRKVAHTLFKASETLLVQPERHYRRQEERHLQRLLASLKVDCVFDVGANSGQYARMLRDYCGYNGLIVSFEPTPDLASHLQTQAKADLLWHIEPVALGREKGEMGFRTWSNSQSNSFLPLAEGAAETLTNDNAIEIKVAVQTLDAVFPALQQRFGFQRPFLKMDTQGYDLEVFAGGLVVMDSFVGLQSELSLVPYYTGAPDWLHSLAIYKEARYVLSALVENNGNQFPDLHEIDCIMTRKA